MELLIAVAFLTVAVSVLSSYFPRASASLQRNRERWVAGNFASSQMEVLKNTSYPYIKTNAASDFGGVANCNCSDPALNLTGFPCSVFTGSVCPTLVDNKTTYTVEACVHLVERDGTFATGWRSVCPDPSNMSVDKGLKHIRLRVTWPSGTSTLVSEMEGMASR